MTLEAAMDVWELWGKRYTAAAILVAALGSEAGIVAIWVSDESARTPPGAEDLVIQVRFVVPGDVAEHEWLCPIADILAQEDGVLREHYREHLQWIAWHKAGGQRRKDVSYPVLSNNPVTRVALRELGRCLCQERNRVVGRFGEVPDQYIAQVPADLYDQMMQDPGSRLFTYGFVLERSAVPEVTFVYEGPKYFHL